MNLIGKKVKAFTLLELILVLILVGIVTLMAYHALNITKLYYHRFNQRELSISALSKLAMVIDSDFRKANSITGDESKIFCDYPTRQIIYSFTSAYVLRSQSTSQDTFHVATKDVMLKKTGWENNRKNNLIKELKLVVGSQDSIFFCFNKSYSAAILFRTQLENSD